MLSTSHGLAARVGVCAMAIALMGDWPADGRWRYRCLLALATVPVGK